MHPTTSGTGARRAQERGPALLEHLPQADGLRRALPARPPLTLVGVLAAVAGVFLGGAPLLALGSTGDPSPWVVAAVALLVAVAGVVVGAAARLLGGPAGRERLAELVTAGTTMALVGVPVAVAAFVVALTEGDDSPSTALVWWPTLLVAGLLLLLWLLPGLQGRPALLAVALLFATWSLAGAVAVTVGADDPGPDTTSFSGSTFDGSGSYGYDDPSTPYDESTDPFADSQSELGSSTYTESAISPFGFPFGYLFAGASDALRAAGAAALVAGIVMLAAAAVADAGGLPGLGTSFVVAGAVAALVGANLVRPDQAVLQALLPLLVVAVLVAVGVAGRRKATVWVAAVVGTGALFALALAVAGSDPSEAVVAALLAVIGVVLVAGAVAVALLRPGRGPAGPPPAAPGASPGALSGPASGAAAPPASAWPPPSAPAP